MRWEKREEGQTGLSFVRLPALWPVPNAGKELCQMRKEMTPTSYPPNAHPQAATGNCTLIKESLNGESLDPNGTKIIKT